MSAFPHLFSPITIRNLELKNRIVFTEHMTYLNEGIPGDRLVALPRSQSRGGNGSHHHRGRGGAFERLLLPEQ